MTEASAASELRALTAVDKKVAQRRNLRIRQSILRPAKTSLCSQLAEQVLQQIFGRGAPDKKSDGFATASWLSKIQPGRSSSGGALPSG